MFHQHSSRHLGAHAENFLFCCVRSTIAVGSYGADSWIQLVLANNENHNVSWWTYDSFSHNPIISLASNSHQMLSHGHAWQMLAE